MLTRLRTSLKGVYMSLFLLLLVPVAEVQRCDSRQIDLSGIWDISYTDASDTNSKLIAELTQEGAKVYCVYRRPDNRIGNFDCKVLGAKRLDFANTAPDDPGGLWTLSASLSEGGTLFKGVWKYFKNGEFAEQGRRNGVKP